MVDRLERECRWLTLPCVDDHSPTGEVREQVVGVAWRDGEDRARLVSCGPPGYRGDLSINVLEERRDGRAHLTRHLVGVLGRDLVEELQEQGAATDGQLRVRAVERLREPSARDREIDGLYAELREICEVPERDAEYREKLARLRVLQEEEVEGIRGMAFGKVQLDDTLRGARELIQRLREPSASSKCDHGRSEHFADNGSCSAGRIDWCPRCGAIAVDGRWREAGQ